MRWFWAAEDITPVFARIEALCLTTQAKVDGLERRMNQMATREQLDAAKAQLAAAITGAANRVASDIQALRDQIANGQPITDGDLADLQSDVQALSQIDPPIPAPQP